MNETPDIQQREERRRDFMSMVTHELRTPLTAIQASIKLMAAGALGATTPDQQEALALAVKNLDRMGRLLNDLLDLSKIEAGRLELRRERLELAGLLRELARTFEPLARERGLRIQADVPQARMELFADRDKITQVFNNLIHNALKFTAHGGVEMALKTQGDYVECRVSDTGAGIAAKDLESIFSKFIQIPQRVAARERGTGLGLALTKRLVELHGGTIRVESRPGEGTTFILLLPKLAPESWFKEEALKVFTDAQANERSCSFIHLRMASWNAVAAALSAESAATLLNHLEELIKTSLRGDYDITLQTPGAFWIALPHVDRAEAQDIAGRIEHSLKKDALCRQMAVSPAVNLQVINYPDTIHVIDELLALVH